MMSQAYRKSISMKIIQLYSKTLRATWQVLENANCTWSSRVCICSICYLTIHLPSVSLKRKTNNILTIMRRMATAEGTRADGPLKQYVWLTWHIHITTRSLHTCIRNVWRPANEDSVCFIMNCDICRLKSWICKHFCEKWFSCLQPTPFCSIKMRFALLSVVTCRIRREMFSVFLFNETLSK